VRFGVVFFWGGGGGVGAYFGLFSLGISVFFGSEFSLFLDKKIWENLDKYVFLDQNCNFGG
jgi:hypothetical protein